MMTNDFILRIIRHQGSLSHFCKLETVRSKGSMGPTSVNIWPESEYIMAVSICKTKKLEGQRDPLAPRIHYSCSANITGFDTTQANTLSNHCTVK